MSGGCEITRSFRRAYKKPKSISGMFRWVWQFPVDVGGGEKVDHCGGKEGASELVTVWNLKLRMDVNYIDSLTAITLTDRRWLLVNHHLVSSCFGGNFRFAEVASV